MLSTRPDCVGRRDFFDSPGSCEALHTLRTRLAYHMQTYRGWCRPGFSETSTGRLEKIEDIYYLTTKYLHLLAVEFSVAHGHGATNLDTIARTFNHYRKVQHKYRNMLGKHMFGDLYIPDEIPVPLPVISPVAL